MLEILYMDNHFVAVNKPAGLMVHRARSAPQETDFALQMVRDMVGCRVYPVHRLDKHTSGVLIFGLHPGAAGRLGRSFSGRSVTKTYLAVVRGHTPAAGAIDKPLVKYREKKIRTRIEQPALTRYFRLGTIEIPYPVGRYATGRYSLLKIRPETGRYQQIRRHLQHVSHPVIGDRAHGDTRHNRLFETVFVCRRMLLAAARIDFKHPYTDQNIAIQARLDRPFSAVIQNFGWHCLPGPEMLCPAAPVQLPAA
ncbi:MAG: pseudouridylate synthase [Desulfobacterales bacterium]|nr:pseudouridylate synthase [Desulfobacterales bacterium]